MMRLPSMTRFLCWGICVFWAFLPATGCIFADVPDALNQDLIAPLPDVVDADVPGIPDVQPVEDSVSDSLGEDPGEQDAYAAYPVAGPNSTRSCRGGTCLYICRTTHQDCNHDKELGNDGDGCETNITSPEQCGDCTQQCNAQQGFRPICVLNESRDGYKCDVVNDSDAGG